MFKLISHPSTYRKKDNTLGCSRLCLKTVAYLLPPTSVSNKLQRENPSTLLPRMNEARTQHKCRANQLDQKSLGAASKRSVNKREAICGPLFVSLGFTRPATPTRSNYFLCRSAQTRLLATYQPPPPTLLVFSGPKSVGERHDKKAWPTPHQKKKITPYTAHIYTLHRSIFARTETDAGRTRAVLGQDKKTCKERALRLFYEEKKSSKNTRIHYNSRVFFVLFMLLRSEAPLSGRINQPRQHRRRKSKRQTTFTRRSSSHLYCILWI